MRVPQSSHMISYFRCLTLSFVLFSFLFLDLNKLSMSENFIVVFFIFCFRSKQYLTHGTMRPTLQKGSSVLLLTPSINHRHVLFEMLNCVSLQINFEKLHLPKQSIPSKICYGIDDATFKFRKALV